MPSSMPLTQRISRPSWFPALNMAGSELNALAVAHVPMEKAKFVVVFHGSAVDGILDEAQLQGEVRYRQS